MEKYDPQYVSDLRQAYKLLGGYQGNDRRNLPQKKYLEYGSPEEMEARQALGRLLRSQQPLDSEIRLLLTGLFDREEHKFSQKAGLN
jgi:hypothetical protein